MPNETPGTDEAQIAADLARRVAEGDASAETELVERYSRGLLFFLRRMTQDPALADDLHQDTFRVVLERLRDKGLEDPGRLAGFLRRTARNLFLGHYRKTTRRKTDSMEEDKPPPVDPSPNQLDETLLTEEARQVRRVIHELETDRDRQLLHRFYILEEPKERICDDLALSSLHFNRVLFRARQRFKDHFVRATGSRHSGSHQLSGAPS